MFANLRWIDVVIIWTGTEIFVWMVQYDGQREKFFENLKDNVLRGHLNDEGIVMWNDN